VDRADVATGTARPVLLAFVVMGHDAAVSDSFHTPGPGSSLRMSFGRRLVTAGRVPGRSLAVGAWLLLAAMAAMAVMILASHLWQWFNSRLVEVEQDTYTQFVVWPIVLGSAVALVGILVAAGMLLALPKSRATVVAVVAPCLALVAGSIVWGFHQSSERRHPDLALNSVIERLQFNDGLHAGPLQREVINYNTPAVEREWRGDAGSLDCAGLKREVSQAFPGASVYPGLWYRCALNVFWRGTTIMISPVRLVASAPTVVGLVVYLSS